MKRLISPILVPALILAMGLLAGCKTVGPEFKAQELSSAAGYAAADGKSATLGEGPALRWWEAFGSAELDRLVDKAMANNRSLAAANATLERARERISAVSGRNLPQVDARARAEYQQVNLSAFGLDFSGSGLPSVGNPDFDLYTVGGGVSYDLDLFGGNRRALEQAVAEAEAQRFQAEAAHLTVAGRVVTQVLAIAALNDRIATERALLAEDQRNVTLTQRRQTAGVGTLVEVLSAQGQLAADQAGLPQLEQQLAEARNMLAILLGLSPAELDATDFSLDRLTLPADVPVALPSALVHKRPDILQAEAQLHAATAAIGVATARLYPDITLGASLTQSTSHPEDILSSGTRAFDFFAALTASIFDGGTRKAEKRGTEAAARASAATYQQTVLSAFGQVSDLLAALGNDARSVANQQQSASIAERSLHLSRRSFEVGNSGILQVLDASRSYQRARLGLVDARSRQFLDVARLYVATAGGWTGPAAAMQAQ
jgi:NodT family efflux transporter outer membrane factor (OMF) lipoprotein